MNLDMDLYDMLEKATEEDILTIITMSFEYYIKKYDRDVNTTFSLIRKGLVELKKMKESR